MLLGRREKIVENLNTSFGIIDRFSTFVNLSLKIFFNLNLNSGNLTLVVLVQLFL